MTFTKTDIALAEVYFPILVDCAIRRQTITYKNLVGQAQGRHPSLIEVQNAIPVSTGRRLDVVKYFCETLGLPDTAGLVVNGQTDEPGGRYDKRHIAVEVQQEAFDFDWHSKSPEFATYIVAQKARHASGQAQARRGGKTPLCLLHRAQGRAARQHCGFPQCD